MPQTIIRIPGKLVGDEYGTPLVDRTEIHDDIYGPYASVAAAHSALSAKGLNVIGQTVGINGENNTVVEYWYQGGTAQANLVEKQNGTVDAYTKAQSDEKYATKTELNAKANINDVNTALGNKQDTIQDLSTIRSGAEAGTTAYQKPSSGIPATDLENAVQTALNKANSAQQPANTLAGYGITDGYTKTEGAALEAEVDQRLDDQDNAIALLNGNDVVVVDDLDDVTTPDTQKIYRVPNHTEEIDVQGDSNALIDVDYYSYLSLTLEDNTKYEALGDCVFINIQNSTIIGKSVTTTVVGSEQYAIAAQVTGATDVADLSYTKTNNDVDPTFYTDYMCVDDTTTPVTWKKIGVYTVPGIDNEPTEDSNKLVKSGGVWNAIPRNKNNIPSKLFMCDEQGNVLVDLSDGNIKTKKFSSPQVYEAINNLSSEIDASSERLQSEIDAIDEKFVADVSNDFGNNKFFIADSNGNVIFEINNGVVKTKNFDSTKIPEEIERLLQIIAENYEKIEEVENKINLKVSNEFGPIRLFVKDENGNVLLELYDGVIKTKSFNSNVLPTINTNNNNEFSICDCFGNVLLSVKNGNIISKYFNSNDVNTLALRVSEIERKSDGYDSLIARSTPAISWIDDDFDTSSAERLGKLNTLKAWAIENNIKPDIALIPDVTYTDVQRTDIESVYLSNERLALAMEFEYSGMHMLTHPIHYGLYGEVIKDGHYIRKDLFLSRKALLDAGFPGCDIFVYAGASAGVTDVVEAAKAYYDVAIIPGGNATNVNLPTKQNRYRLVRFSLDDISATNTVSQIKQQIDDCIATGGWIIFITHVWLHTGDGTEPVDETSNSLSNVFNIIQYANQKVQIRPTQEVWKEKKILWEYYK